MYVRWKRRNLPRVGQPSGEYSLTAVLVRAVRVDGKPRQQIVCYLATIQELSIPDPLMLVQFWDLVGWRLTGAGIGADEYKAFKAKIAERVPEPTQEQYQEVHRMREKFGLPETPAHAVVPTTSERGES